jgi:hypothetical protein
LKDDGGEGLSGCEPGGVVAGGFSPRTQSWRSLPKIDAVPEGLAAGGLAMTSTGVGWTGREAVFETRDVNRRNQLLLIDPESGRSRLVPVVPRADAVCAIGTTVLAVVTGRVDENGGVASPNPAATNEPLRTFELDAMQGRWRELAPTAKPDSADAFFEEVHCDDGQLAYLPVRQSSGYGPAGLWWNPDRNGWETIPSFGPAGFTENSAGIAGAHGVKMIEIPGAATYFLPPGAKQWDERGPLPEFMDTCGTVDGDLCIETTPAGDETMLGILDIAQYLAGTATP